MKSMQDDVIAEAMEEASRLGANAIVGPSILPDLRFLVFSSLPTACRNDRGRGSLKLLGLDPSLRWDDNGGWRRCRR